MEIVDYLLHEFRLPLTNPVLVFSLILFIILISPILLKRLNIPGIIVLIISGVLIGPYGFNFLEKNSAVDLFSTIGLLYIMFIAGLEMDLNEFKSYKHKSILFGFFTFIFPLSIGFPVSYYILGYGVNASLLISSMFATHTLVAYPIVSKLGVSKNQAVAVTVGGTILTDTAVLIILAIIMGNNQGELSQQFWIRLGVSLVILSVIMFFIIPKVSKWFFSKLESEKHSHYIFVLSIVFLAAFLSEVAGLEPIIGAFMAGLALNKLIPHSSALMNRIEFIGNALFIPFFLISVGMLVNIKVLLSGYSALIVAGTLTVVALFGKWIAALFTQLIFKYSSTQRKLIFGLSSSHAAATLAVILVGYKAGILDENILNGTIILILITCIVASFSTEKAARELLIEKKDFPDNSWARDVHSEHILMPTADVSIIEKLLEFSVLIKDKKSANPISILTVVSYDNESEKNILNIRNEFETFIKQASATETQVNIITTIDHNIASGITRISKEIMASIVILGWPHKKSILDKLIGEKIDNILNNTDKTVFLSKIERSLILHKRIIVVAPPFTEVEKGFETWLLKISELSSELSIPVIFYCNQVTIEAIGKFLKRKKLSFSSSFNEFNEWDDFLILSKFLRDNDLFVLVSARKGSASYIPILDSLPIKIEKHFSINSRFIIYPQQFDQNHISDRYEDVSAEPLNKGVETIKKISKGLGDVFRR